MSTAKVHVMPNPKGGWQVKREGSEKIIETFDTKEEAMDRARVLCGNSDAHLVEHSSKGTIQSVTKSKKQESPKKKTIVTKGKIVVRKGSTAKVTKTATGKTVIVVKEKSATKKAAAKKKAPAKKTTAKKAPAKKAAPKKAAAKKKAAPKKTVAKKTAVKKPATKKTPAKKAVAKKPVAKKTVAKKKPVVVTKRGVVTKSSSGKTVVIKK